MIKHQKLLICTSLEKIHIMNRMIHIHTLALLVDMKKHMKKCKFYNNEFYSNYWIVCLDMSFLY